MLKGAGSPGVGCMDRMGWCMGRYANDLASEARAQAATGAAPGGGWRCLCTCENLASSNVCSICGTSKAVARGAILFLYFFQLRTASQLRT